MDLQAFQRQEIQAAGTRSAAPCRKGLEPRVREVDLTPSNKHMHKGIESICEVYDDTHSSLDVSSGIEDNIARDWGVFDIQRQAT